MGSNTDSSRSSDNVDQLDDIAKLNIYQKLARITGEVGIIKKDGHNRDQGYAFIEYAAVAGELRGLLAKYGVVIVPRMPQLAKQQREQLHSTKGTVGYHALIDFTYTVVNADKPDDKFTVTWTGESTSWDDKGTNKAATSAQKYFLMRQFNISEKGDDPDAVTPEQTVYERDESGAEYETAQHVTNGAPKASPNKPASEKQLALINQMLVSDGYSDDAIQDRIAKISSSADASELITKLKEKDHV